MSLAGKRVVVTRAQHQVGDLLDRLTAVGAIPIVMPVIDIVDADDAGSALNDCFSRLDSFDWLVVTSGNTVMRLPDVTLPDSIRVAAIGSETARRLEDRGWRVDLVPPEFVAESLVDGFPAGSGSVLLPRAAVARDVLPEGLRAKGWEVTVVDAYKTIELTPAPDLLDEAVVADYVTFAAPSAVRAFTAAIGDRTLRSQIVCIGPITQAAVDEIGLKSAGSAQVHTIDGLVSKLEELSG